MPRERHGEIGPIERLTGWALNVTGNPHRETTAMHFWGTAVLDCIFGPCLCAVANATEGRSGRLRSRVRRAAPRLRQLPEVVQDDTLPRECRSTLAVSGFGALGPRANRLQETEG